MRGLASGQRLARMLALTLLLPLAQVVATAHTITHHGAPQPQRGDAGALGLLDAPCALCLSAAPLHAGALPSAGTPAPAPPAPQSAPIAAAPIDHPLACSLAYRSRAPPVALR